MTEAPREILAWTFNEWGSAWNVDPEEAPPDATRYVRADAIPLSDALAIPEVAALVEAACRLCNELEMPGERGVLHNVPGAIAETRAALRKIEEGRG